MKMFRLHPSVLLYMVLAVFAAAGAAAASDPTVPPPAEPASDPRLSVVIDDSAVRRAVLDRWLTAPLREVRARPAERRDLPGGGQVEIRAETIGSEVMVEFARRQGDAFVAWARGSWILYRRLADGAAERIRIFPTEDANLYLQLRPAESGRVYLDAVAYGGYVGRNIVLPVSWKAALTLALREIVVLAGDAFPRRYFEARAEDYADTRSMAAAIRAGLPGLRYADDGAFDEQNRPVHIADLSAQDPATAGVNCSGFAKWVIDGLLRPLTGERLAIPPLVRATLGRGNDFTAPYEDSLQPYFGLDWTRNLAAAAGRVLRGQRGADPLEYEVRKTGLIALRLKGGDGQTIQTLPVYEENAGFAFEGLLPMLYALAVDEPGYFYLASVNDDAPGGARLRRHFHVAVLMPHFDAAGRFVVPVFESAAENGIDAFIARYPGCAIHLARVPVERIFAP
jgi:hypothetical protein